MLPMAQQPLLLEATVASARTSTIDLPDTAERYTAVESVVNRLVAKLADNQFFRDLPFDVKPYPDSAEALVMTTAEYIKMQQVIDPLAALLAEKLALPQSKAEHIKDRSYREIIPKSIAFAGRVIHDYDISESDRATLPQAAVAVYFIDTMIDRGLLDPSVAASLTEAEVHSDFRTNPIASALSFDSIIGPLALPYSADHLLREVCIHNSLILPMRFQKGDLEFDYKKIAELKIKASGYDISIWTAMYALYRNGIIQTDPQVLMRNPYLEQIRRLGGAMTKFSDDIGDIADDKREGVFNVADPEHREQVMREFCNYCWINPTLIPAKKEGEQTEDQYNQELLHFLMVQLSEKIHAVATVSGLSDEQKHIIKILTRSAIICYENSVGDPLLYA